MTQKEKFETGKYIRVAKSRTFNNIPFEKLDNDDNYWLEREFEYFFIHKNHEDILDSYLLDNDVEIEQCSNGDWYEININPYYDAFIRFYDENNEYRLKHSFEEQLINEVIGNGVETIQAPNSDIKFIKPEFECELWHRDRTYILGKVRLPYDIKLCRWDMDTGICREDEKYNLTPYQEKKEWYRDESNFPCVIVDKMNHNDIRIVKENMGINWEVYRPATNEEIDSLKIKDANF